VVSDEVKRKKEKVKKNPGKMRHVHFNSGAEGMNPDDRLSSF
jgi:hypothetical protein